MGRQSYGQTISKRVVWARKGDKPYVEAESGMYEDNGGIEKQTGRRKNTRPRCETQSGATQEHMRTM
jgi:hypothetical protein